MDGVRSRPARSVQVEGHSSSVATHPDACTSTTASLIAATGYGRSARVMPAVPASGSVTTIAFIACRPLCAPSPTPAGVPSSAPYAATSGGQEPSGVAGQQPRLDRLAQALDPEGAEVRH